MRGFVSDLEDMAELNHDFRRVIYTGRHMQLVLMTLRPGEDIGEEVHDRTDQFFRVEEGWGEIWIDGVKSEISSDDGIMVPAGARHNLVNSGAKPMKLFTLYSPPAHADGTVHATRREAEVSQEHFTGRTTE